MLYLYEMLKDSVWVIVSKCHFYATKPFRLLELLKTIQGRKSVSVSMLTMVETLGPWYKRDNEIILVNFESFPSLKKNTEDFKSIK